MKRQSRTTVYYVDGWFKVSTHKVARVEEHLFGFEAPIVRPLNSRATMERVFLSEEKALKFAAQQAKRVQREAERDFKHAVREARKAERALAEFRLRSNR